ncbi:MBL fold metallo-hydrolase [Phycicoccus avicenniae]|uniref:MBL fold metallo-hydrolase n=1 Tax=Phycicoccus avicenniae TaxID=2828860 RepID=UPI003D2B3277
MTTTVTTVRLRAANVHLVRGARGTVLVDSGTAAAVPALRRALRAEGVEPASLGAVVLTHGHADHAGGARLLVGEEVPVVAGAADAPVLEAGRNPALVPTNLTARVIRPFVDRPFPAYRADVLVEDRLDLSPFGVDLLAVVTGGHTPGSLVVLDPVGPGPAVVGDLVRGGAMGGAVRPGTPYPHYYSDDTTRDLGVVARVVEEWRPTTLHLGHGGPVAAEAVLALSRASRRA